jgi:hypothetical protein
MPIALIRSGRLMGLDDLDRLGLENWWLTQKLSEWKLGLHILRVYRGEEPVLVSQAIGRRFSGIPNRKAMHLLLDALEKAP